MTSQEPGPFELMPRLYQPPTFARRRPPILGKELTEEAPFPVYEDLASQLDQFVSQDRPSRVSAALLPSKASLEQVHVRIGLEGGLAFLDKGAIGHATSHQAFPNTDRQGLQVARARFNAPRGFKPKHDEGLIIDARSLVQRRAIR